MLAERRCAGYKCAVRKLFRDTGTGKFLCTNAEWTSDMTLACDFLNNDQAQLRKGAHGARAVEWLYAFDYSHTTRYDFTVEILPLVGLPKPKKASSVRKQRGKAPA